MPTPPTPSGLIQLLNVPFDSGYKNVLDFDTDKERFDYMQTRILTNATGAYHTYAFSDCQYSRRDGVLKVPVHIDNLYACNYLMFKNPQYSKKWIYCFVTGQRYINDNCTELRISTDVYSTWISSAEILPSYVEREHTNDDRPGANLVPEGLETGELVPYQTFDIPDLDPVVCVAYYGDKIGEASISVAQQAGAVYNGIPSSIPFLLTSMSKINNLIELINAGGGGVYILTVFAVPKMCVKSQYNETVINSQSYIVLPTFSEAEHTVLNIEKPETIGTYTPRNKKLLTYPYCYLGFTAPNGTPKIYRYENFLDNSVIFWGYSEVNPNPTVVISPYRYIYGNDDVPDSKENENTPESVTVNGYPTISFRNDVFNSWLAQNSQIVNLSVDRTNYNYDVGMARNAIAQNRENANAMANMVSTVVGGVTAAISGNALGTISSGVSAAQNTINHMYNIQELGLNAAANTANWQYDIKSINAQMERQALLPDTGTLSSSNASLLGYGYFSRSCFSKIGLKEEFAKKIDQYFNMFGYQTNTVKQPNLRGRAYWNYIKTININIKGEIPTQDLSRLKGVFDGGVTIWHKPEEIYNYGVNNGFNYIIDPEVTE